MATFWALAFWLSLAGLAYVYVGYPVALLLWHFFRRVTRRATEPRSGMPSADPPVSVVIAARNESSVITQRIANVLAQNGRIHEVIIGSDGSTDDTADIARWYPDERVKVLEFTRNRGKALVNNDCMRTATGQLVIFTDAETEFKPGFVELITEPFTDPAVGVAVGKLMWRSAAGEQLGAYWTLELALRALESDLGLLATGSGACMAVRRSCFKPLLPDEDVDFSTPIQVVRRGMAVVYVPEAVATDAVAPSARAEFRARSRMVTKNLTGTLRELRRANPVRYPGLWWSVLSHKVLRWLTPLFALVLPIAVLGPGTAQVRPLVLMCYALASLAALTGAAAEARQSRLPVATLVWSLAVANAGMLAGLIRAAVGRRTSNWEPIGHQAGGTMTR